MLFGTNNTFSLRFHLAERETKLERSEKFVDSRTQTCLKLVVLLFFARISGTLRLSRYSRKLASLVNNLEAQARFAEAASKAAADMADPEKKAEWQAVANVSNGKLKIALFYA